MKNISKKIKIILILLAISTLTLGYFSYDVKIKSQSIDNEIAIKNERIKELEKKINGLQTQSSVELIIDKLKKEQLPTYKPEKTISKNFKRSTHKTYTYYKTYEYPNNSVKAYTYKKHSLPPNPYYSFPLSNTKKIFDKVNTNRDTEKSRQNNYNSTSNYSSDKSYSYSNGYTNPNHEYVQGYTKKNGTHVEGYYRTKSNSTKSDNFSTKGNINPYTGKKGTK